MSKIPYQRKPIPDFEKWEVDTKGNVFFLSKKHRFHFNSRGYPQISLRKQGKSFHRLVHRLILEVFNEKCPEGMEACHNDGVKTNNQLENLRWDTPRNNQSDRKKHGTANIGSQHGRAKLTEYQIQRIRLMKVMTPSITYAKIAKMFNVTAGVIYCTIKRRTWKHII